MKKIFFVIICLLLFLQIACGQTQPINTETKTTVKNEEAESDYPNLKIQAGEVAQATVSGDFAKLIDYTYPKILAKLGGKDKMLAFLKNDSAQMKAEGFELEAVEIGKIKQIVVVDNEIFAVVPMTMKIKSPNGKAIGESSFVGVSNDNGKNWKFLNGINQERFKSLFPRAAEKLQIPVDQAPKIIENE